MSTKSSSHDAPSSADNKNLKKPTKPLNAYLLFSQLEREYILQTTPATEDAASDLVPNVDDRIMGKDIPSMPCRYHNIRLSPFWYLSGSGKRTGKEVKKRKHRKTHGKISLVDLSKNIAARWDGLEESDREAKEYVTSIARREREEYQRAMQTYKEKYALALLAKSSDVTLGSNDADVDESTLGSKGGSIRSLDDLSAESAGEAAKVAPPDNIFGRATAASSSERVLESNFRSDSMSLGSSESMSSMSFEATAGLKSDNKNEEKDAFDNLPFHLVGEPYENRASSKRGGRHISGSSSKMPSQRHYHSSSSKLPPRSFEISGVSTPAPRSHSQRESMPPMHAMKMKPEDFEGEDIHDRGSYSDPGGVDSGRGTADHFRFGVSATLTHDHPASAPEDNASASTLFHSSGSKLPPRSFENPGVSTRTSWDYQGVHSRQLLPIPMKIQPAPFRLTRRYSRRESMLPAHAMKMLPGDFVGEDIQDRGSYNDPGGIHSGRGPPDNFRFGVPATLTHRRSASSPEDNTSASPLFHSSGSKLPSRSFENPGSSSQALWTHSRRDSIPPMHYMNMRPDDFAGEGIWAGGGLNDPGGIDSGQGAAGRFRAQHEPGAYLPSNDPQQGHRRGREHGLSVGAAPIDRRPVSATEDSKDASATDSPPLGLDVDAHITKEDAMGLMETLSDDE